MNTGARRVGDRIRAPERLAGKATFPGVLVALAAVALVGPRAFAVGLEGPASAQARYGAGVALGWDQVGGLGRDGFAFSEVYGHADRRWGGGLALAGALSVRGDLANFNHALGRWRGGSAGLAGQLLVGYDGPRFHVSAGSWIYGDNRDGRAFRMAFLPYPVLRVRLGALDGWHVNLRLLDGAPYTAEGAATGLRLQVGAPPRGPHRVTAGIYASIGEKTVGLAVTDEITGLRLLGTSALRWGILLGTDLGHPARPELMVFSGVVF